MLLGEALVLGHRPVREGPFDEFLSQGEDGGEKTRIRAIPKMSRVKTGYKKTSHKRKDTTRPQIKWGGKKQSNPSRPTKVGTQGRTALPSLDFSFFKTPSGFLSRTAPKESLKVSFKSPKFSPISFASERGTINSTTQVGRKCTKPERCTEACLEGSTYFQGQWNL